MIEKKRHVFIFFENLSIISNNGPIQVALNSRLKFVKKIYFQNFVSWKFGGKKIREKTFSNFGTARFIKILLQKCFDVLIAADVEVAVAVAVAADVEVGVAAVVE